MFFNHHIALIKKAPKSKEEAFLLLANELDKHHCVTNDFYQNVVKREEIFPTGLEINGIGVAIPHTDSEYVTESQVAFLSLEKPLTFLEMGSTDKQVSVSLLFMLALKEPHEQLEMLQKLIAMFQNPAVLEALLNVTTTEDYLRILENNDLY